MYRTYPTLNIHLYIFQIMGIFLSMDNKIMVG
jgi:hypothetical protein